MRVMIKWACCCLLLGIVVVVYYNDTSATSASSAPLPSLRGGVGHDHDAPITKEEEEEDVVVTTTSSGVVMPRVIYGTAWKKERTAQLVFTALSTGFRGIDTACQPKHYNEPGVGEGIARALSEGVLSSREELFLQTKVNPKYASEVLAPGESVTRQVEASIAKSLSNLGVERLDSLVLHSPYPGLTDTLEAWRAMEAAVEAGTVRQLGISNVRDLAMLQRLYETVDVKPAVVQQRFHAKTSFERPMRAWCRETANVRFQSFWTLTANSKSGGAITSTAMKTLAAQYGVTPQELFIAFVVLSEDMIFLTGTTSVEHMRQDLNVHAIPLSAGDAATIDGLLH